MVSLQAMLAWLVYWKPVKPSSVGLAVMCPLGYVQACNWPLSWRNHAQLGGGSVAERLMSKLAYGWVERCSDVAGCEWILHQEISAAGYSISANFILMLNELMMNMINAGMYVCFHCMIEDKCICVCLISAFEFCLCSWGIFARLYLMFSSRPLRRLRDGDVTISIPFVDGFTLIYW